MNRGEAVAARPFESLDVAELTRAMPVRVHGPRAVGVSLRRFITLTWLLAYMEFKLRFFGSVLGYLWQLVRPLLMFGVLYLVFTEFVKIGDTVERYPLVLLAGIVTYTFFSESTNGAVPSLVDRESLIRKISFPILAVPVASVTSVFLNFALNYSVVLVFMLVSGVTPGWGWLEIFPLVILLYLSSLAVSMVLSAYYVRFRDVAPIWEVLSTALFYASPIIYPIEYVQSRNETAAQIMMCNPITAIIQQMRHAVIDPTAPSAADAIGGAAYLLIPLGLLIAFLAFGYWSYVRLSPRIAEEL